MRPTLLVMSALAYVVGVAAIAFTWLTQPPHLGLRLIASVLLIDQATLAVLLLRLPVLIRGLVLAARAGSALAIVAGALVLVFCALPHPGPVEIAMPAVGVLLLAHGAITWRYLQDRSRAETA